MKQKRIIPHLVTLLLAVALLVTVSMYMEPASAATVTSGSCGESLQWSMDLNTGVLTISGSGRMTDYSYSTVVPWLKNSTLKDALQSLVVEEGVTSISQYAFKDCTLLSSVQLPDSLVEIGFYAFNGCTALKQIILPENITTIASGAFRNCTSLTSVILQSKEIQNCSSAFYGSGSEENGFCVEISDSATCVPTLMFSDSYVTDVHFGSSIKCIDNYAFSGCEKLEKITIPDGVETIGAGAFSSCTALSSITLPDSVRSIDFNAFNSTAYYNEEDNWQEDLLYIGNCLIGIKNTINQCTIGSNVVCIADRVFYDCPQLTEITVSENNPSYATLNGVLFDKGKTTLIRYPANQTDTSYTIPQSVTQIAYGGFYDSANLAEVSIPSSVQSIDIDAFRETTSLKNVTLPESVTSISAYCFYKCTGLENAYLGSNTTDIGTYAFYQCTSLREMTIPDSVSAIASFAFCECRALSNVSLGNSLTTIGIYAFARCSGIEEITIPNSVSSLGSQAFANCSRLSSVNIPTQVSTLSWALFSGCSNLVEIIIPDSVTTIDMSAFSNCGLQRVVVGKNVATINSSAFNNCLSLERVVFTGDAPTSLGSSAFNNVAENFAIYYLPENIGWTTPTWNGYPAYPLKPEVSVSEATQSGNSVSIALSMKDTEALSTTGNTICAIYSTDGKMLGLASVPLRSEDQVLEVTCNAEPAYAKIFVLDGMETLFPLQNTIQVVIS